LNAYQGVAKSLYLGLAEHIKNIDLAVFLNGFVELLLQEN
jgi:hypothetical protein